MPYKVIDIEEWFARIKCEGLGTPYTFLTGAGCSRSAGIPLAIEVGNRIAVFEQLLVQRRRPWDVSNTNRMTYADDLGVFLDWYKLEERRDTGELKQLIVDANVRIGALPDFKGMPADSPRRYSQFFHKILHSNTVQHQFLSGIVGRADAVNLAHVGLAGILARYPKAATTVFTTNFDDLLLQALLMLRSTARVFGDIGSKDPPDVTADHPQIVHLHGRHTGYQMQNTEAQLLNGIPVLRDAFKTALASTNLVVIGYSGWDDTVMQTLQEWTDRPTLLRGNLYWIPYHDESSLLPQTKEWLNACPPDRAYVVTNKTKDLDADRFFVKFLGNLDEEPEKHIDEVVEAVLANAKKQHAFLIKQVSAVRGFTPQLVMAQLDAARMDYKNGAFEAAHVKYEELKALLDKHGASDELYAQLFLARGQFELYRDELRQARTALDNALLLAESAKSPIAHANTLKALGGLAVRESNLTSARMSYAKAHALFASEGDRLGMANTLRALGNLALRESDLAGARSAFTEALGLFDAAGDRLDKAYTLKALGDLELRESNLTSARETYAEAHRLFDLAGSRIGKANILRALGDVAQREDDLSGALESYSEALMLFDAMGDRLGKANTLRALGRLAQREDDLSGARVSYTEALALYDAVGDRLGKANTLRALGGLAQRESDLSGARASYTEALALYVAVGDRLGKANTLQVLGDLAQRESDLSGARVSYTEALALYAAVGDRLGKANTLQALGDLAQREDDLSGAREAYLEALVLFDAVGDRLGKANTLRALGGLAQREDDLSGAWALYTEAFALYDSVEDRLGKANTLQALGGLAQREGDVSGARTGYMEALTLYDAIEDRLGKANTLQAMGGLAQRESDLSSARGSYMEALALYEALGTRLGKANTLQALGDLALQTKDLEAALEHYRHAEVIYRVIGERFGLSNALAKIISALNARGDRAAAEALVSECLALAAQSQNKYVLLKIAGLGLLPKDFRTDAETDIAPEA